MRHARYTARRCSGSGINASRALLLYAMMQNRILLTHDRKTMPGHFDDFLRSLATDEHSPGVMTVEQLLPVGTAIDAILVVWVCSTDNEWRNQFVYLPM